MSGSTRLRSSFPSTPQQGHKSPSQNGASPSQQANFGSPKLPDMGSLLPARSDPDAPLIPFSTIDAPSQRFYVVGVYTALAFWRLWDFYHLTVDETESLWQFMKWVSIDGVFLFGLPGLRIPWLEWSSATMTVLFLLHAILDGVLMFRIPIPLGAALVGLSKLLYDRESAVGEHWVKPGQVSHNPSLILGRQIIHILPEGSAVLNPQNLPLCLDTSQYSPSVNIPLQINQTNPVSIELVRFDLDTSKNETIIISASQTKKMRREAEKTHKWQPSDPLIMTYTAKKVGLYRLSRVIDETRLEVQKRASEALVVQCPIALVRPTSNNRCRGELSNMMIEVKGTPPLKIRYRKTVDEKDLEIMYSSIQPDDFVSPLMKQQDSTAMVMRDSPDLSWAAAHRIEVPLNETLLTSGHWSFSIEEVADACNNVVQYRVVDDLGTPKVRLPHSEGSFVVHDLPKVSLSDAVSVQKPLKAAKGDSRKLPLKFASTGRGPVPNAKHKVDYLFTPTQELTVTGEHGRSPRLLHAEISKPAENPAITEAGLYTLRSVSTQYCAGEVEEPASVMLINPPAPGVVVTSEEISDRCAGRPIGLKVGFDFVGTPPFVMSWTEERDASGKHQVKHQEIKKLRGQLELKPPQAGHYRYTFTNVRDELYLNGVDLQGESYVLNQDVKPSVAAQFLDPTPRTQTCIDQPVAFDVILQGEKPWTLEWELVHAGKRAKHTVADIHEDIYTIKTDNLSEGGDYTLALVSVVDRLGCKETLQQDVKISVRHQRPKAAFGNIEGKRTVRALAGKTIQLPIRLSGEIPFQLTYRRPTDPPGSFVRKTFQRKNDALPIKEPGLYEITDVQDVFCPGTIDVTANTFEVILIGKPSMSINQSPLNELVKDGFIRKEVCEGEEDALDVVFQGRPPFDVKYEAIIKPDHGEKALKSGELHVPLHSAQIKMDTAEAGSHEYRISALADNNYDHKETKHPDLVVRQKVNPRPSASFTQPGKVYSFCHGQNGGPGADVVPITLQGQPPFTVDLELKHGSKASRATPITIPNIFTHNHDLRIPHHHLQQGNSALSIRRVRDARGCERQFETIPSYSKSSSTLGLPAVPRVQISVHDLPTITPVEPTKTHYCVGEHISFALSGQTPFSVFYTFEGKDRKAMIKEPVFRRIAETPGNFTITGISDAASTCRGNIDSSSLITGLSAKIIHPMPSVRVSKGRESRIDIHAGGEAEILFEFGSEGTPPFEFTYTRSENARKGGKGLGAVLETKTLTSEGYALGVKAGEEGTYEVVAVRDRYCAFARPGAEGLRAGSRLLME